MNERGQTGIAGVDYSMTCPCVCVFNFDFVDKFEFDKCKFYFLIKKKKWDAEVGSGQFQGEQHKEFTSQEERFNNITNFTVNKLWDLEKVFIEGYSFGSVGQVFNIAENTGVLKNKLFNLDIPFDIIAPSVIKKYATGKGNADKEKMYDSFVKETKCDLFKIFEVNKLQNPITDIVDSYYITKLGYDRESNLKSIKSNES